jgi:hypothetical protein
MNDKDRILLFLFGCMTARILLALLAKYLTPTYLQIMGVLTLIPAFGMMYLFFFGKKKAGAFGGKLWWNNMRMVHGLIYLIFSICAIMKKSWSWMILMFDVVIGLTAFLVHYLG